LLLLPALAILLNMNGVKRRAHSQATLVLRACFVCGSPSVGEKLTRWNKQYHEA
jgi:hypothetical protein